jgi:hypothetical protein
MLAHAKLLAVVPVVAVAVLILQVPSRSAKGRPSPLRSSLVDTARETTVEGYGRIPTSFEPNEGQAESGFDFLSRGYGYSLILSGEKSVLFLRHSEPVKVPLLTRPAIHSAVMDIPFHTTTIRCRLIGSRPGVRGIASGQIPGKSNYLRGSDRRKWITDIPHYARITYSDVYRGIDLVYHGATQSFESDFVVNPGAKPETIVLATEGTEKLTLNNSGDLEVSAMGVKVQWHKPYIYQEGKNGRHQIAGGFRLLDEHRFSFEVGPYDSTLSVVIDPVLSYSTYLGGIGTDRGHLGRSRRKWQRIHRRRYDLLCPHHPGRFRNCAGS